MDEWRAALDSFVEMFASMDFRNGPLVLLLGMVISGYCCLEGFKIYKMILTGLGFLFGYRMGFMIFSNMGLTGETLLMAEVFLGLISGAVAYRVYLAGIFIAAFQFGLVNLPVYVEKFFGEKLSKYGSVLQGVMISVISLIAAIIVAKLAVQMSRTVIVCLTAVVGGFGLINNLLELIPQFPYTLYLPGAASVVWLFAKVFVSMAGAGIQGVKDT